MIVITFVFLFVVNLEPLIRQFFVSLIISLLVSRILWVFESQLMYQLMFGYELDRALILRQSEKNIFEMVNWKKFSSKVNIYSKSDQPTASISNQQGGNELMNFPGSNQDQFMLKGLEKYSKLKNKEELNIEIDRVKEEIKLRQVELVCLENMIFASEQDSKSQSQSRKKSSHGIPQQQQQRESGISHDNGGGYESGALDTEKFRSPNAFIALHQMEMNNFNENQDLEVNESPEMT